MIYVIAGNYAQYQIWLRDTFPNYNVYKYPNNHSIYAGNIRDLQGRIYDPDTDSVMLIGTYYERPDLNMIMQQLHVIGWPRKEGKDLIEEQLGG